MPAPQTQHKSIVPLSDQTRTATACAQWLLESAEDAATPIFHFNHVDVLVCGEESFASIAADIEGARKSIDIIAWGFDPAMELVRDGTGGNWPRGGKTRTDTSKTYGDLLRAAARRGVKVRLLVWYSPFLELAVHNMPGYRTHKGRSGDAYARGADTALGASPAVRRDLSAQAQREAFNIRWYNEVVAGEIQGLSMRTRGGHYDDVVASLKASRSDVTPRTGEERLSLEIAATHHQKTIAIDHDDDAPDARPLGYVMGLNSVTEYWDTTAHRFDDPRRGQKFEGNDSDHSVGLGWESVNDGPPTLKPYQDYVCRIEGEAVAAIVKNFAQGWNDARQEHACAGSNDAGGIDLGKPPQQLTRRLNAPYQRVQIVRTVPGGAGAGERSIERSYYQAGSFARHFIYIENQYFQHAEWVRHLKAQRRNFVQMLGEAGLPVAEVPTLHVMAVVPTPERTQMVPRTHDVVTELGHGDSMPEQDRRIREELAAHADHERALADYEAKKKSHEARGLPFPIAPPYPRPLSEPAKAHLASSDARNSQAVTDELASSLGMRALVCSLWSHDEDWSLADTEAGRRADQEQRDHERALRQWERQRSERARGHADAGAWGTPADYGEMARPKPPPDRSKELRRAMALRYREVYIHSKLMIIDDAFFTLGSANLNLRSFAVDTEINMASDNREKATALRRRVWGLHTHGIPDMDGGASAVDEEGLKETFNKWKKHAQRNLENKLKGDRLSCALVKFYDERTSVIRFA